MARLTELADADGQSAQWLANHVGLRHPWLGFVTKGEHEADHRLHYERLDHKHERRKNAKAT